MPKQSKQILVQCFLPDAKSPDGYKAIESLNRKDLEKFRKRNAERISLAIQNHYKARPEAWSNK